MDVRCPAGTLVLLSGGGCGDGVEVRWPAGVLSSSSLWFVVVCCGLLLLTVRSDGASVDKAELVPVQDLLICKYVLVAQHLGFLPASSPPPPSDSSPDQKKKAYRRQAESPRHAHEFPNASKPLSGLYSCVLGHNTKNTFSEISRLGHLKN